MVFRPRQATSGTILCLASAILLALVSFNTPLLKSMYFLEARFSSGQYAGSLRLGTLGYCLTTEGVESCVGPTVGYNFNPNTLFNISTFNIPEAITRYLTYTLILHIIALGFAVCATILGLFDHISTLSLLCFPTCSAWLTSTCALLALIFDLVIFYIAKSRIESVSGASASIGISVWLTLAAWLCAGLSGCAFPLGKKWGSKKRESGDPNSSRYQQGYGNGPDAMRLHAIQDEQARKKEQGLPSFTEIERQPLTAEDKYLYEDQQRQEPERTMPGALRRDGSVLNGVGVGYGRRQPRSNEGHGAAGGPGGYGAGGMGYGAGAAAGAGAAIAAGAYGRSHTPGSNVSGNAYGRRPSASDMSSAGNAGVGAGPAGIDRPGQGQQQQGQDQYDGYYDQQQGQDGYYDHSGQPVNGYSDPYSASQAQAYSDPYNRQVPPSQSQAQPFVPGPHSYNEANYQPSSVPTPAPALQHSGVARTISDPSSAYNPNPYTQYPPNGNNENGNGHYPNPHDQQARHSAYGSGGAYGGYDDSDGLGAIGMAAQSDAGRHQADYTGHQQVQSQGYSNQQIYGASGTPIHAPKPQHLSDQRMMQSDILRSPMSPSESDVAVGGGGYQHYGGGGGYDFSQPRMDDGHGDGDIGHAGGPGGLGGGGDAPPPSYGAVPGASSYRAQPEKAGYRPGQ